MAPSPVSGSASQGAKPPPTGPKALRAINGHGTSSPGHSSPFGQSRSAQSSSFQPHYVPPVQTPIGTYAPAPAGLFPTRGTKNLDPRYAHSAGTGSRSVPSGPRIPPTAPRGPSLAKNGSYGQQPHAESSRHPHLPSRPASSSLSNSARPPSPRNRPPSPPPLISTSTQASGRSSFDAGRSRSPVGRRSSITRNGSMSPVKRESKDESMEAFRARMIRQERSRISIAVPSSSGSNGHSRPLPPHMVDKAKDNRSKPPSPPRERPPPAPPTPPPPPTSPPPPPSPPPAPSSLPSRHPSPPSNSSQADHTRTPPVPQEAARPFTQSLSNGPNSPSDSPKQSGRYSEHLPLLDSTSRRSGWKQSLTPNSRIDSISQSPAGGSTVPPSFHFRDIPVRPSTPADDDQVDERSSAGPSIPPSSRHSPDPSSALSSQPPLPQSRSSEAAYVTPPWVPPPSASRRPGLGNYLVISDVSKYSKGVTKRYDGLQEGEEIVARDPRLSNGEWKKGRGTAKNRPSFYEIKYEWDEFSTGPKPPPPPPAVLITNLDPLTTVEQIRKFLQPHGKLREIDSKMDLKSGMQLGICWVKFDGPAPGKKGTAHDVAVHVTRVCDGQRIGLSGTEKIRVVLDGRGLRAEKAVKEEMVRRYPPKQKAPAKPAVAPTPTSAPATSSGTPRVDNARATPASNSSTGTPGPPGPSGKPIQVRPLHGSLPSRPRPPPPVIFDQGGKNYSSLGRSLPVRAMPPTIPTRPSGILPSRPIVTQTMSSAFTASPFSRPSRSSYYDDLRDSYSPRRSRSRSRTRSRSRSRSHPRSCTTCGSDSDNDRPPYRSTRRSPSPAGRGRIRGRAVVKAESKQDPAALERVKKALEENAKGYVFIDTTSLPVGSVSEEQLKDHFRTFKPAQVLSNYQGWYILFYDDLSASKSKILDNTLVQGRRLVVNIKSATTRQADDTVTTSPQAKANWRLLTITKKNKPAPIPVKPRPQAVKVDKERRRQRSYSTSDSDDDADLARPAPKRQIRSTPATSEAESEQEKPLALSRVKTEPSLAVENDSITAAPADEPSNVKDEQEQPIKAGKKRAPKPKVSAKAKKARIMSPEPLVQLGSPVTPEVAEIKLDDLAAPVANVKAAKIAKIRPVKVSKPKKVAKTELEKFLESGVVEDEEDAYWLGQAIAASHEGIAPDLSDVESDDEDTKTKEDHPLYHTSGSWRAEGIKKIPQMAKPQYLPERNRAVVSKDDASALTSGRTARVTGRRLAHDMETTRKTASTATAESDMFAFNQLRIRKKQLRFSRSPIEGYGLYAMETIHPGEMVCEYVGEICRSAVADVREQRYMKQGIGSSYLFRIDADVVCDATFKGSVSRLINHSCDPSASAKIISINGQSKIVIYAKKTLHPGQEILYDYKFPLESDPTLRVPCLCGAATCRGWLN